MIASRAVDRVALGMALIFTFGVALSVVMVTGRAQLGDWFVVFAYGVLGVLFVVLAIAWWQAAVCRIRSDGAAVTRSGPIGWRMQREEIAEARIVTRFGQPYLVVVPAQRGRRSQSLLLAGRGLPASALIGPVESAKAKALLALLDQTIA